MKILVSFPGRAGDIIWMLPTARAIAEAYDTPVDLQIAGEFAGLRPLLAQQPYLGQVSADPRWGMDGAAAPAHGPFDLVPPDHVFHLDYRGWPEWPLPLCPYTVAQSACAADGVQLGPLDLLRPWITVDGPGIPCAVAVGFTEAWFELKLGLLAQVDWELETSLIQLTPLGSRWTHIPPALASVEACDWLDAARAIRNSDLFFGDCSALHVLAVALGKRCILMEPMEARHNEIFYPLGKTGPQVTLVTGNDGLPTFDARHCIDALRKALP